MLRRVFVVLLFFAVSLAFGQADTCCNVCFVSKWETPRSRTYADNIGIKDNYLFMPLDSLYVLEISDSGFLNLDTTMMPYRPTDLAIKDSILCLTSYHSSMIFFLDISNPSSPESLGYYYCEDEFPEYPNIHDTLLFVFGYGLFELLVINFSDPSTPSLVARHHSLSFTTYYLEVHYPDVFAAVSDGGCFGGLWWFRFADLDSTYLINGYGYEPDDCPINFRFTYSDSFVYGCYVTEDPIVDWRIKLTVLHTSFAGDSFEVVSYWNDFLYTTPTVFTPYIDFFVMDTLLFMVYNREVQIFNISNPYDIERIAFYGSDSDSILTFKSIAVKDSFVFLHTIFNDSTEGVTVLKYPCSACDVQGKIETGPSNMCINAYPNPFNASCAITLSGVNKGACSLVDGTVEIYDLRGNVVYETPSISRSLSPRGERDDLAVGDGSESPSPSGEGFRMRAFIWMPDKSIPSGIYLVRATTEDGQTITKRIVYVR